MKNPETLVGKIDAAWNYVEQIGLALSIGDVAHANTAKSEAARLLSLAMDQTEPESDVEPPKLSQAELYAAIGKLMERIEACGASTELTNAVTLASDIRQAVGNQWNKANEFAADRVRENIADGRTFTDSLRCKECPEIPGQIHRGGGVYSLCPPCNGTGFINPENREALPPPVGSGEGSSA